MRPAPLPGDDLEGVDTPALLVDAESFDRNLAMMAALAARGGIALRPHAKSHKTPVVAQRQIAAGAVGICCAKLGEAEVMVSGGVADVLITTPVVGRHKLERLARCAHLARMAVVVDSPANLAAVAEAIESAGTSLDVLIEVDVGQNRCGVRSAQEAIALADIAARCPRLTLRGLQGYNGAIQGVPVRATRHDAASASLDILREVAETLRTRGHDVKTLTGGGTGTIAIDIALGGLTESQAGSYIYMDSSYRRLDWEDGAPIPFATSLSVLSTVISRPTRDLAVLDAGWKALSSDAGVPSLAHPWAEEVSFGGDEHLKVRLNADGRALRVGDRVAIIPSHCDTTVNLYDHFVLMRDDRVEQVWPILGRGRSD
jgi:D-serine deaminase-like pyridoxal phosphate-dependent protein